MKIGYPCINNTIGCTSGHTFRLKSYSEDRLKETIKSNLTCLERTLEFNKKQNLRFFRICSGIVPFASHPVNQFDWQHHFRSEYEKIGTFIAKNGFRISVHPDQFTLINSPAEDIFERSKKELQYHAELLDTMNLDSSAKIQIHVGGAYGDKTKSMQAFIDRYRTLDQSIKSRLVIENDERLYDAKDCLAISQQTGIPVLFDVFHHKINHRPNCADDCFALVTKTWKPKDGVPMVDYSSQKPTGKTGQHAETIDIKDFTGFLVSTLPFDFDIMLEIKDKEVSAQKALQIAIENQRIKDE